MGLLRLTFVMALLVFGKPAVAYYYVSNLTISAQDPYIVGDQLFVRGGITVREEPCTRPDAHLKLELWAFQGPYWPELYRPAGFKLVTIELPTPTVVSPGACASTLDGANLAATIQVPQPGTYYLTYFLTATPSDFCGPAGSRCYESFANVGIYGQLFLNPPAQQAVYAPTPVAYTAKATAVEYYHQAFNHYFLTTDATEIEELDAGRFPGWARTGQEVQLWSSGSTSRAALCRFFSATFAPQSSHFYTPLTSECGTVKQNPDWIYEGVGGYVDLPALNGNCAFGPPIYRLYNNGMGGAPNHRYTRSLDVRAQMVSEGWTPEGFGDIGVIGCSPP